MSDNKSANWDWSDYFDNINDPPIRETVEIALQTLGAGQGRQAVDLGCGAGNDTVHMLNAGFKVLAVDSSAEGLKRLRQRPESNTALETRQASFHRANWPQNVWTNAGFALPFCPQDDLQDVWKGIDARLMPGGIFSGQFFGTDDSWKGKVSDMNFHSESDVKTMAEGFKFLHFREEKGEGKDAVGRPKFWHIFHVVLQKHSK